MENSLNVIRLDKSNLNEAYRFLEDVFTKEQGIPNQLIPPPSDHQKWWCIRKNEKIIATAAAWKIDEVWHWGRLAIDSNERGLGLSKKITLASFYELFNGDADEIIIEARDITVHLLKSCGAEITGPTEQFYGLPITPMTLRKEAFVKSTTSK